MAVDFATDYDDPSERFNVMESIEKQVKVEEIPPQESYLYTGKWNERSVTTFVNVLVKEKREGYWKNNGCNDESLAEAHGVLNLVSAHEFTWDDVLMQVNMLKKKYVMFRNVLNTSGVHWDRGVNFVRGFATRCSHLTQADDFANAYFHKGDLLYDRLHLLFEPDSPRRLEIIQISSGDVPNCARNPISVVDSDDELKVESPVTAFRKPPRTRLFDSPVDSPSCFMISAESNNLQPGEVRQPFGITANNMLVVDNDQRGAVDAQASSCASCSPHKLSYSHCRD